MKRWVLLFAIGWLASMAWLSISVGEGSETSWSYLLALALFTAVPTLVQVLIVPRLWRCGPSLGRTLGILSLPFIGLAIAWWPAAVMLRASHNENRDTFWPGYFDYLKLVGWGVLPGLIAWWGFRFFPREFPERARRSFWRDVGGRLGRSLALMSRQSPLTRSIVLFMKRWFLLFAIGWLASIAWLCHIVSKAPGTLYWDYMLDQAVVTSLPTLVQVPIVLRLSRCGPSWGRALGIVLLPFIGLAIASLVAAVMTMHGHDDNKPSYFDYYLLAGWGALPGIFAWFGFLFRRDLP